MFGHSEGSYRERKRERRIKDAHRMNARGAEVHGRSCYERPDGVHHLTLWVDREGKRRIGLETWADVLEARAVRGRLTRDNLASCSCPSCGNQRRHEGITMQERRAGVSTQRRDLRNGADDSD